MNKYDVPGYEDYLYVTDDYKVFRKPRIVIKHIKGKQVIQHIPEREVRIIEPDNRYQFYRTIRFNMDKHQYTLMYHRIIASVFVPNPNNLPEVNHKDCDKLNNDPSNLEWISANSNRNHAAQNFRYKPKDLPQETIDYIITHFKERDKQYGLSALGRKFNIDKRVVRTIVKGFSYKYMR